MNDQIISELEQSVTVDNHTIEIHIFRTTDKDWTLELLDEFGNSTVWEEEFATDEAALGEALQAIQDEGISAFVGKTSDVTHN